jgi:hypothetical protein
MKNYKESAMEYVIAGVEGSGFEISQNPKKGRSSPSIITETCP